MWGYIRRHLYTPAGLLPDIEPGLSSTGVITCLSLVVSPKAFYPYPVVIRIPSSSLLIYYQKKLSSRSEFSLSLSDKEAIISPYTWKPNGELELPAVMRSFSTGCQHRPGGESELLLLSGSDETVLFLFLSKHSHEKTKTKMEVLSNIQSFITQYENGQVSIKISCHIKNQENIK